MSERETLDEAHQNASLPTERVTTSTLGLHHSVPADITMSSGSTRPPSLNDGTNQDMARPAVPTVSTHEGEPSMAQILTALVNTQALLANTLSRGPPTTSPIQINSTSDTSSSIPLFDGTPQQSAHEWIKQSGFARRQASHDRVCRERQETVIVYSEPWSGFEPAGASQQLCQLAEGQPTQRFLGSICPTLAATLDVTLGTTDVRLEVVVVTELPSGIDLIPGSDWRRVANVDVTFHTSNDVTIVPVEPSGKFSSSEVPPLKQGTQHRAGETLIATFCRHSDESVYKDEGNNCGTFYATLELIPLACLKKNILIPHCIVSVLDGRAETLLDTNSIRLLTELSTAPLLD
ncbi:hypothetical protein HPB51_022638 [Rhipicephalus microplus]|uniref:Uncharacterized protein n=1 Tax=Rhipicephalus microplus TaxID=6941 RepID=A0A9J6ECF5_RHIMP|nr:hypothetical protein HPB51_022638 [Rhipicephalus microplus]